MSGEGENMMSYHNTALMMHGAEEDDLFNSLHSDALEPLNPLNGYTEPLSSGYAVYGEPSIFNVPAHGCIMQSSCSSLLPSCIPPLTFSAAETCQPWQPLDAQSAAAAPSPVTLQTELLQTRYGVLLSPEELLAFDALPALLSHTENDPPASLQAPNYHHQPNDHSSVQLEYPSSDSSDVLQADSHGGPKTCSILQASKRTTLQANDQGGLVQLNPCLYDPSLSAHYPFNYKSQDVSSPGTSATSSSALSDGDQHYSLPLSEEASMASILLNSMPYPFAVDEVYNDVASWIKQTKPPRLSGGEERGCSVRFDALMQCANTLELTGRLVQHPKLQGITLDQVLQAEKMQHILHHGDPLLPHAQRNPLLSRNVPANVGPNGARGGPNERNTVSKDSDEGIRLMQVAQTRKPAATSVDPQSVAARERRQRIKEKTESLGLIIPGATRMADTAAMLDLAIKYVHFLQAQMVCLENEVSLTHHRASCCYSTTHQHEGQESRGAGFSRALLHRLLSSQEVQHALSREGLCLVTQSLASCLNFDPTSLFCTNGV